MWYEHQTPRSLPPNVTGRIIAHGLEGPEVTCLEDREILVPDGTLLIRRVHGDIAKRVRPAEFN